MLPDRWRAEGYRPVAPFNARVSRPCPRYLHGQTVRVYAARLDADEKPAYYLARSAWGEVILAAEEVTCDSDGSSRPAPRAAL